MRLGISQLQPIQVVAALFWSVIATSAMGLLLDRRVRIILNNHWKLLLGAVALVLMWRFPFQEKFFHGLEYEDSYVYSVAGRQIYEHVQAPVSTGRPPYSFDICALGSLKQCERWEPYPEHLIGYPYIISCICKLVGYRPAAGSILNLLFACLSSILIFFIAQLLSDDRVVALSSAVVFAVVPVFGVYGLETSAEPALNWCICIVLWFFLRYITSGKSDEPSSEKMLYWGAYTSALLFSECVKREGALLALVLPLTLPVVLKGSRGKARLWLKTVLPILGSSVIALLLSVHMRLAETAVNEASLAKQFPLTIGRLEMFVTGFLRSFLVGRWYVGSCFAVALGILIACRRRDLTIVPVAVLLAYIALYALHIRGYYEMQAARIDPSEALRFSMSLMGVWALAAGIGICGLVRWRRAYEFYGVRRRFLRPIFWVAVPSMIAVCFGLTLRLRDYGDEDERNVRIKPALAALELARGNAYIASLEPLVVQMYGAPTDKVVDLETVSPSDLGFVSSDQGPRGFLFIEEALHDSEPDEIRYGPQMQFLKSLSRRKLYDGADFRVIELGGHTGEAGPTGEVTSKRRLY